MTPESSCLRIVVPSALSKLAASSRAKLCVVALPNANAYPICPALPVAFAAMVAGRCERLQIYFATDGIRRARALGTETLGHLDRSKGRDRELREIEIFRIRIVENLAVQCDERLRGIRGTQGDDGYGIRRTAVRSRDGCRRQLFERIGDMVESRFFERLATEENRRNGSARQCQTSIDGDAANRAQLLCVERMEFDVESRAAMNGDALDGCGGKPGATTETRYVPRSTSISNRPRRPVSIDAGAVPTSTTRACSIGVPSGVWTNPLMAQTRKRGNDGKIHASFFASARASSVSRADCDRFKVSCF